MQIKYESCILYVAQGVGVESTHEWLNTTRIYIYILMALIAVPIFKLTLH